MKTLCTTLALTLLTNTALAHPGHDHAMTPGGEQHHLLWAAAGMALVIGVSIWACRRYFGSK